MCDVAKTALLSHFPAFAGRGKFALEEIAIDAFGGTNEKSSRNARPQKKYSIPETGGRRVTAVEKSPEKLKIPDALAIFASASAYQNSLHELTRRTAPLTPGARFGSAPEGRPDPHCVRLALWMAVWNSVASAMPKSAPIEAS